MNSDTQFHDKIREKLSEVFTRESQINQAHPFEAFVILTLLAISPILDDVQNLEIHMTFRVLVVTLYMGFMNKQKKFRRRGKIHPYLVTCSGLVIQTFSSILFILDQQSSQHCQNYLMTVLFLLVICNRFRITHIRQISYSVSFVYLLLQIYLHSHILQMVKYFAISFVGIEGTLWRITYSNSEYEKKLTDFYTELELMKENYVTEINKLQENIEVNSQEQLTSRANDLLKKLRLIKYQQLLIKNNKIQQGIRKQNKRDSEVHKNAFSLRQLPEQHLDDHDSIKQSEQESVEANYKTEKPPQFRRKSIRMMTSATDQQKQDSSNSHHSFSEKNIPAEEVKITIEDIDDLLNLLSGRKDTIWLPKFLRSNQLITEQEGFTSDAKKFLISHFTQKQSSFQYISHNDDQVQEEIFEELRFNEDYLKYQKSYSQDKDQTRVFLETSLMLFKRFRVASTLKVYKPDMIGDFILTVNMQYQNNLYHNSMHAIDVTNSTAFFLENGLDKQLDDFEAVCLIISSLAHDIGHPGLNNGFMMSNRCKLALLYNDQSVLENYHSFLLFQILQQEKFNLLGNLGLVEQKGFRKYCLNLILDTDLTRHFQLMNKFQNYLELSESQSVDKALVMSICIKCADVGHGAKELKLHKQWSRRIIEEFFLQGDLEQYLKVPISPMCDRKQSVAKSQEGFLKAIVLPMFDAFSILLQNDKMMNVCVQQIHQNLQYWQQQHTDDEFMRETHIEPPGLEVLKKFLNQPLQLSV